MKLRGDGEINIKKYIKSEFKICYLKFNLIFVVTFIAIIRYMVHTKKYSNYD